MSNNIKAFIFDLDGVITDTAEYHYKSWQKLADEEGLFFNREINEQLRGVSRMDSLEIILDGKELAEDLKKEMTDRKNAYYQKYLEKISKEDILDDMESKLIELKEQGFKIAVASSSRNARKVLKNLKISDLFDTISDGNSVENAKPAPDLFLHTAEKLGVEAEECVVLEDAESGVDAALAANMIAVGVGPDDRVGKAHLVYSKVAEIDFEEILEKI
ncbi:beta-phosphoglucomutase [Halanaerobium sp. Z-7514]|uniref:Beta-phosphoglucomutase n=1 Tax=Halanaerobium polyolivorans TaxID=2886943 RepID=A0AAW4X221_9FIRM|nr:beta-phosphoglucomutase [Halanaerobium polyolivorans]MCC3145863.1 beta-phosphoglucomutase [Halanaerobium polyolivorans]RQD70055.1 MAG: beta-phosphoglucomutase [Halanaerobium sp. MSAO_Bac5]